jgi:hypothetical protein
MTSTWPRPKVGAVSFGLATERVPERYRPGLEGDVQMKKIGILAVALLVSRLQPRMPKASPDIRPRQALRNRHPAMR